jgi:hypothetical protein
MAKLVEQNKGRAIKGLPPVQINIGEELMQQETGGIMLESTSCDDTKAIPLNTGCYLKGAANIGGQNTEVTGLDAQLLYMGQAKIGGGARNSLEWDPEGCSEDTIKFLGVRPEEVQELEILSSLVSILLLSLLKFCCWFCRERGHSFFVSSVSKVIKSQKTEREEELLASLAIFIILNRFPFLSSIFFLLYIIRSRLSNTAKRIYIRPNSSRHSSSSC